MMEIYLDFIFVLWYDNVPWDVLCPRLSLLSTVGGPETIRR